MNGRKAKALRLMIYGKENSSRFRAYRVYKETGVIITDPRRRAYKEAKKMLRNK